MELRFVPEVRKRDFVVLVVYERVQPRSRDDESHFREAEILSVELPAVPVVYFVDFSFPFREYPGFHIVQIDFPHDSEPFGTDGHALEDGFP